MYVYPQNIITKISEYCTVEIIGLFSYVNFVSFVNTHW